MLLLDLNAGERASIKELMHQPERKQASERVIFLSFRPSESRLEEGGGRIILFNLWADKMIRVGDGHPVGHIDAMWSVLKRVAVSVSIS